MMVKIKSMTLDMLSSILMSATILKGTTHKKDLDIQLEKFIINYSDIRDRLYDLPFEITESISFDYSFPVRDITLMSVSLINMINFYSAGNYDGDYEVAEEMISKYESIYDHIDRCLREV